jgi:hypothetical protein
MSRMEFLHTGEAPGLCFRFRDRHGQYRWVVVGRITYAIGDGGALTRLDPQPPLQIREEGFGDVLETPLRHESDLAPEKPRTDLVIHANAYAPGGRATTRFEVALAVRERDRPDGRPGALLAERTLAVTGPRAWRYRGSASRAAGAAVKLASLGMIDASSWSLGDPDPVVEVPLRFDHAYGGTVHVPAPDGSGKPLALAHGDNPVGRGFLPRAEDLAEEHGLDRGVAADLCHRWAAEHPEVPAPQIEPVDHPLRAPWPPPPLAGWGLVAKHWEVRYRHAGTLDEAWIRDRYPVLPTDFDPRYWNGAHPDLQLDAFPEDAVIETLNLVPPSRAPRQALRIALPGTRLDVHVRDATVRRPITLRMKLDTVVVDLLAGQLTTVYRASLPDSGHVSLVYLEVAGSRPAEEERAP